jgi:hypothetical protein
MKWMMTSIESIRQHFLCFAAVWNDKLFITIKNINPSLPYLFFSFLQLVVTWTISGFYRYKKRRIKK